MATGYSIHIGLNGVDPNAYNGWAGTLAGCVNDANAMKAIADSFGYSSVLLLNGQATSAAVIQAIGRAAQQMNGEDILLLTYSGHGGIVDDVTGGEPGDDGKDETWVLYDRMLLDDELEQLWTQFADGARIFVLSDSCHSGTVTRELLNSVVPTSVVRPAPGAAPPVTTTTITKEALYSQLIANSPLSAHYNASSQKPPRFRSIPLDVQNAVYSRNRELYSTRQWAAVSRSKSAGGATVLLISGCQDNQLSADGDGNGLFTGTLLQVWNNGSFRGNYMDLRNQIVSRMPATQTPNYFVTGPSNAGFEAQRPFTVEATSTSTPDNSSEAPDRPAVHGPSSLARDAQPPTFQVNTGANGYYIFEITSDPSLFDTTNNAGKRNQTNFYGSWQDDGGRHMSGLNTTYTLPSMVWSRLKNANALYYRIGTMAGPTGWDQYTPSTYDNEGASAPRIQLLQAAGRARMAPSSQRAVLAA